MKGRGKPITIAQPPRFLRFLTMHCTGQSSRSNRMAKHCQVTMLPRISFPSVSFHGPRDQFRRTLITPSPLHTHIHTQLRFTITTISLAYNSPSCVSTRLYSENTASISMLGAAEVSMRSSEARSALCKAPCSLYW